MRRVRQRRGERESASHKTVCMKGFVLGLGIIKGIYESDKKISHSPSHFLSVITSQ